MIKISQKQQNILKIILEHGAMQSSVIHEEILKQNNNLSLVSVKRALSEMAGRGLLIINGSGRSTGYRISNFARVFLDIDAKKYIEIEPDKRFGSSQYNFVYFSRFLADIFDQSELERLDQATKNYKQKIGNLSKVIEEKELQRLIIELSWKSSKIEGNTYTLVGYRKTHY